MVGVLLHLRSQRSVLILKHNDHEKIATILASAALLAGVTGCESFLEEESYGSTTDIFNEENGLKAFVNLSYTKINNLYGGDGQWPLMTELGTDIFLRGKNQGDTGLTDYYGLDANNGNVSWLWNHCYKALANINMFMETIDSTPLPTKTRNCSARPRCS